MLMQQTEAIGGRRYYDYVGVRAMAEGVVAIFEDAIKTLLTHRPTLSYTLEDINTFIDTLHDISCLTCVPPCRVCVWGEGGGGVHCAGSPP